MLEVLQEWFDELQLQSDLLQLQPEMIAFGILALGVVIAVFGLSNAFAGQRVEVRRMYGQTTGRRASDDFDLVRGEDNDTHGLLRAFVPSSTKEKSLISTQLRRAGICLLYTSDAADE